MAAAARALAAAGLLALVTACSSGPASGASSPLPGTPVSPAPSPAPRTGVPARWVATWAASPQPALPGTLAARGFRHQTVRDVLFTSAGGTALRVELSNAYGRRALRVGGVTVGVAAGGAAVRAGTLRPVTFGRAASVVIPAGRQAWSDPVAMAVPALADLTVSIYLPGGTGPATTHVEAWQDNWVSRAGDYASRAAASGFVTRAPSWYFAAGVSVLTTRAAGTVVAFGDSITDGTGSTVGGNDRWPNLLARRLDAVAGRTLSVVDAGIGGNRLLASAEPGGPSGLSRFARDALSQPGVADVIVLEGVNDILNNDAGPDPGARPGFVTAAQLIAGYRRLIAAAHARGVRIFGATILPFRGLGQYTPAAEQVREQVNDWILTSGAFDGVVDFASVVQARRRPLYLNPAYNSGDDLHPDDAGYRAMAGAVDLGMLLRG